jgi:hypothetical protein
VDQDRNATIRMVVPKEATVDPTKK